jgi:hypothetical protein
MNKKLLIILPLLAIAIVGGAFIAYAYTTWNQTVTWTDQNLNFNVYPDPTTIIPIAVPSTLNLIVTTTSVETIDYYIENEGNVEIRVTGSVAPIGGTVNDVWTPLYVDVPVGTTRELITLELSNFSVGGGSITVSFTSVKKP